MHKYPMYFICSSFLFLIYMLTEINFELLICISEYLNGDQLAIFSSSHHHFYALNKVDYLWRRLCRFEFGIKYNDPNQPYRQLYFQCKSKKFGRLPCVHYQEIDLQNIIRDKITATECQRCFVSGQEHMFVCLSSDCNHRTCRSLYIESNMEKEVIHAFIKCVIGMLDFIHLHMMTIVIVCFISQTCRNYFVNYA
jgi:hypothetical protein